MTDDRVLSGLLAHSAPVEDFITWSRWSLARVGFGPANVLPVVGVCRDELMAPFDEAISQAWGRPFQVGALGGLVFAGATGLAAALSHVPGEDGRQRFVVFAFPHLGIDADGIAGPVARRGLHRASTACGALAGVRACLAAGLRGQPVDPAGDDIEAQLLAARLERLIPPGDVPTLTELTLLARDAAVTDLRRYISAAYERNPHGPVDVAYLSGVLLHLPGGDAVADVRGDVVIDGEHLSLPH